jgi:cell wall-associated NlpC family hydrolase
MPATVRRRHVTTLLVVVLTAVALAAGMAAPADAARGRHRKIHTAVAVAVHQKGDRYRYGADGPRRFDCSGLTQYSYGRAGLHLPRTSGEQARYARRTKRRDMRPGDLMFFHTRRGRVYHVAIYTGRGRHGRRRMVHAPSPGSRVRTSVPWTSRWFAGTLRRR